MADFVEGPPRLDVCENCPNLIGEHAELITVSRGKAEIILSETSIDGVYIPSHGRGAGTFHENSTALENDALDTFANCDGPRKTEFFQKLGIVKPDCPALESLIGGNPTSGDIVQHYAQKIG